MEYNINMTASEPQNWEDKWALIKENLIEVLNPEIAEKVLKTGEPLKIYWGTATTGKPHCGYFVPVTPLIAR